MDPVLLIMVVEILIDWNALSCDWLDSAVFVVFALNTSLPCTELKCNLPLSLFVL